MNGLVSAVISLVVLFLCSEISLAQISDAVSAKAAYQAAAEQGIFAPNMTLAERFADYCSKNPASCVISALYAAQSIYSLLSSAKAGKTKTDAQTTGYVDTPNYSDLAGDVASGINPSNLTSSDVAKVTAVDPALGSALNQAKSVLDQLKSNGVTLNKDGSVTTPNGTIAASALGSMGSLSKALNLSDADKELIQKIGAEAMQKAKYSVASVPTEGGGRGGGQAVSNTPPDLSKMFGALNDKPRNPAQNIAGMSKTYGSDRIGVAGDNIFQMISRRYMKMMNAGEFQTQP